MPAMAQLKTKPRCAICLREVDMLTEHYDEFMARVRYVAHCHGEREYVDMDEKLLAFLGDKGIAFWLAFQGPPRLKWNP
jgi:hypothetical protein